MLPPFLAFLPSVPGWAPHPDAPRVRSTRKIHVQHPHLSYLHLLLHSVCLLETRARECGARGYGGCCQTGLLGTWRGGAFEKGVMPRPPPPGDMGSGSSQNRFANFGNKSSRKLKMPRSRLNVPDITPKNPITDIAKTNSQKNRISVEKKPFLSTVLYCKHCSVVKVRFLFRQLGFFLEERGYHFKLFLIEVYYFALLSYYNDHWRCVGI